MKRTTQAAPQTLQEGRGVGGGEGAGWEEATGKEGARQQGAAVARHGQCNPGAAQTPPAGACRPAGVLADRWQHLSWPGGRLGDHNFDSSLEIQGRSATCKPAHGSRTRYVMGGRVVQRFAVHGSTVWCGAVHGGTVRGDMVRGGEVGARRGRTTGRGKAGRGGARSGLPAAGAGWRGRARGAAAGRREAWHAWAQAWRLALAT